MITASGESGVVRGNQDDAEYDAYLARVNARFQSNIEGGKPLFTTDAEGLWEAYLNSFNFPQRQHHTCRACEHFIKRFGGLVTIGPDGMTTPAIWSEADAPELYQTAVASMSRLTRRARITGVFLSPDVVLGTPKTGIWRHLSVTCPAKFKHALLSAGQAMAEKKEDFKTVMTALQEFSLPHLETALALLETDSLYRAEKVMGPAQWLRNLHVARAAAHGSNKANVVWLAIATAPAGFCHPRASMVGTLLEDIAAGMDFAEVSRRFRAKMHPLAYQRPQAAPTSGAIAAAEKVVEQLGAAGSLARRFCRLDEVKALWLPTPAKEQPGTGGVFGHLKTKMELHAVGITLPPVTMTWDKFQRTVLPTAEQIEFFTEKLRDNYAPLVTAVNPDAAPIFQWDREDARNPVSWYVWQGGSSPSQFVLAFNAWNTVDCVTLKPSLWYAPEGTMQHQGQSVLFILRGAKETRQAGAAIFPECLRSEFHGVRSVIEAYSHTAKIEGMESPHAVGIMLDKGGSWNARFRVTAGGRVTEYKLDRWD